MLFRQKLFLAWKAKSSCWKKTLKIVCKEPFVDISPSSILRISPYFWLLNSSRKFSWTFVWIHFFLSSSVTVVAPCDYVQSSVKISVEIWAFSTVILVSHSNSYSWVLSCVDVELSWRPKHWCSHSWQFGICDPSDRPITSRLDSFISKIFLYLVMIKSNFGSWII